MFNAGPTLGAEFGAYRGDPLYHVSLNPEAYARLLEGTGFDQMGHAVGDVEKAGGSFGVVLTKFETFSVAARKVVKARNGSELGRALVGKAWKRNCRRGSTCGTR